MYDCKLLQTIKPFNTALVVSANDGDEGCHLCFSCTLAILTLQYNNS
jgi:hypothetical protein